MIVAAVSDSHGSFAMLNRAAERLADVDFVFHLGDTVRDAAYLEKALGRPVFKVAGNCDIFPDDPDERIETVGGLKIFACHGHELRVKFNMLPLSLRAAELGANIALFGHTHARCEEYSRGVLLVNPGALRDGRLALLRVENGSAACEFISL